MHARITASGMSHSSPTLRMAAAISGHITIVAGSSSMVPSHVQRPAAPAAGGASSTPPRCDSPPAGWPHAAMAALRIGAHGRIGCPSPDLAHKSSHSHPWSPRAGSVSVRLLVYIVGTYATIRRSGVVWRLLSFAPVRVSPVRRSPLGARAPSTPASGTSAGARRPPAAIPFTGRPSSVLHSSGASWHRGLRPPVGRPCRGGQP